MCAKEKVLEWEKDTVFSGQRSCPQACGNVGFIPKAIGSTEGLIWEQGDRDYVIKYAFIIFVYFLLKYNL